MHAGRLLSYAAAAVAIFAFGPLARAQAPLSMAAPPSCPHGYYDYPPYPCAPPGYYGPGYFYNGIFLGVGPWANWGYLHGWGQHRFTTAGGGHYIPGARPDDLEPGGTSDTRGRNTGQGVHPESSRGAPPPQGAPQDRNAGPQNTDASPHRDEHPQ